MTDDKNKGLDSRTQIILAVVGLIGTVSVALFANWDKLASKPTQSPSPTQSSTPSSSSNATVSLPIGDWQFNGNGFEGPLKISAIDVNGNVQGSVMGNEITGFWDEDAQKITFIRIIDSKVPSTLQFHTGYAFSNRDRESGIKFYTLTGSFEGFAGTGAKAQRTTYGWYARIKQ